MASQALEQMLELAPTIEQESRAYQTLDVYTSGLSRMYIGPRGIIEPMTPLRPFFPTNTGFGINVSKPPDIIKDYHETFKIDRYDNLYGGHSSITPIGGNKLRIDHDK